MKNSDTISFFLIIYSSIVHIIACDEYFISLKNVVPKNSKTISQRIAVPEEKSTYLAKVRRLKNLTILNFLFF